MKLTPKLILVSAAHFWLLWKLSIERWCGTNSRDAGLSARGKKRQVSSNQAPELFVCWVKAIRPVAAWWKSCQSRQWGPKRAKMSEVFNAALMYGGRWKMTTSTTSKMLSPNLTVWRKMFGSFCLSGLNVKVAESVSVNNGLVSCVVTLNIIIVADPELWIMKELTSCHPSLDSTTALFWEEEENAFN